MALKNIVSASAIEAKMRLQAEYIVWRDGTVEPSQARGGPGRGKRIKALKPVFPATDPGDATAHRWRKRFTREVEGVRVIDPEKLAIALTDAQ